MDFETLKSDIKKVTFEAVREDSVDYFEAVLVKKDLAELTSRLNKWFGSPAVPSDKPVPPQAQAVISEFGDIMVGQTLYFWSQGSNAIFAMLWPWGDKDRITLKMGQVVITA